MITRKSAPWQLPIEAATPEHLFFNRRKIIKAAGVLGVGALAGCNPSSGEAQTASGGAYPAPEADLDFSESAYTVNDDLTSYDAVTGYNNFYEFGTGKDDPARYADEMTVTDWKVTVDGRANNTGEFALTDLVDYGALEERVYRLRCVEAWSMVVPWVGVPLSDVIAKLEPTDEAKYVKFETYLNPEEMRGVRRNVLDWPYVEGLRMDEAMNELAFVAVGVYGKALPKQNGAPVRIVVPWKYGFKSAKSIARISFISDQPRTAWQKAQANEYGFYSNVNPTVSHPRWSQASERIIGAGPFARRDTEMFNGYEDQVAHLYEGMDLSENF